MSERQRSLFKKARPCPFCGGEYLTWMLGAITCDECQASGPFVGHPSPEKPIEELAPEGVRLWNGAPR